MEFATRAIHEGYYAEICFDKPLVAPIFLSSTYECETIEKPAGDFYYSRCGNRSRDILEKTVASLEDAEYGLCFSSGMATIFSVVYLLNPGDHMICSALLYGGTMKMLKKYAREKGIDVTYVDLTDTSLLRRTMKTNTKMIYCESCCNPLLSVTDIASVSEIARENPSTLLVVDNTFMTPYFQKPLQQGADIVLHSATKYLNVHLNRCLGHGDVVMGVLATQKKYLYEKLKDMQSSLGFVPSPFDCYMMGRGLKTLHLRMKEHAFNAEAVAIYLETEPLVDRVVYPGLPSHPQYSLAKKQSTGSGGMVGFYVRGGREQAESLLGALSLIKVTGSLGQPNSLICCPATLSHANVEDDVRLKLGVTDNYLRLSVGLESFVDLVADLRQAFNRIRKSQQDLTI